MTGHLQRALVELEKADYEMNPAWRLANSENDQTAALMHTGMFYVMQVLCRLDTKPTEIQVELGGEHPSI